MSTHDYDTALVRADTLNSTHVLVGESGGLSAIYDVRPCRSRALMDKVEVETEHGVLYFDRHAEMTVLAV